MLEVRFDLLTGEYRVEGRPAIGPHLSAWSILAMLLGARGRTVTYAELVADLLRGRAPDQYPVAPKELIDVHISRLRSWLDGTGWTIRTVWGVGLQAHFDHGAVRAQRQARWGACYTSLANRRRAA